MRKSVAQNMRPISVSLRWIAGLSVVQRRPAEQCESFVKAMSFVPFINVFAVVV
jgi:hypothetical protein